VFSDNEHHHFLNNVYSGTIPSSKVQGKTVGDFTPMCNVAMVAMTQYMKASKTLTPMLIEPDGLYDRLVFIGGEETYHLEKDLRAAVDMAKDNVFFDANRLLSAIAVDVFTEHYRDREVGVSSKEYKSVYSV
jgi:hypothetical protein